MTKEEKIKEAYGEYWTVDIDLNGWVSSKSQTYVSAYHGLKCEKETKIENDIYFWRPKSLQGIENNNGWVKIESEDDLPKSVNIMYRVGMFLNDGRFHQNRNLYNHTKALEALYCNYTHYQPVTENDPPLY